MHNGVTINDVLPRAATAAAHCHQRRRRQPPAGRSCPGLKPDAVTGGHSQRSTLTVSRRRGAQNVVGELPEDLLVHVLGVGRRFRCPLYELELLRLALSRGTQEKDIAEVLFIKTLGKVDEVGSPTTITPALANGRKTCRAMSEPSRSFVEANGSLHSNKHPGDIWEMTELILASSSSNFPPVIERSSSRLK